MGIEIDAYHGASEKTHFDRVRSGTDPISLYSRCCCCSSSSSFFLLLLVEVTATLYKKPGLRRFKLDRDEIWQDCSSSKYTSIDAVGFSV